LADKEQSGIDHSWLDEEDDGQLAIDVFQNDDEIVLVAPIAGVRKDDLDIAINDEMVTIKGTRKPNSSPSDDHYFLQECYWGPFSRNYILPIAVLHDKAKASLKDGLLTITIPKDEKTKSKSIEISEG
jgi:HSP20 family protein